jgi:hypothetical protein
LKAGGNYFVEVNASHDMVLPHTAGAALMSPRAGVVIETARVDDQSLQFR